MRYYSKPELTTENFSVDDPITASTIGVGFYEDTGDFAPAPSPDTVEFVNNLTVEHPSGVFNQEVTGGNPVQEALNTLYENFLNRF